MSTTGNFPTIYSDMLVDVEKILSGVPTNTATIYQSLYMTYVKDDIYSDSESESESYISLS
jgi:hypothetical protein